MEEPGSPREESFVVSPARRALIVLVSVLMLAGGAFGVWLIRSQREAPSPNVAAVPSGWTAVAGDGFSLALPPGWFSVPREASDEALSELEKRDPEIGKALRAQLGGALSPLIRFLAVDTTSPADFVTNMNVVVQRLAGVDFDRYVQSNLSQARSFPGVTSSLEDDRVALPAGRAALVRSRFALDTPTGASVAAVTQYLLLSGGNGFILSFTTTPAREPTYTDMFEGVARTFRPLVSTA